MLTLPQQLAEIRQRDAGRPRKKIVILGAGMAGLAAAYELLKLGHQVEILEASDRVGGRVYTHRFGSGEYHEFGAMRIPASHDYTRHYIREFNLQLRSFITSHANDRCFYHIRGITTTIREAKGRLFPHYRLSGAERRLVMGQAAPALLGTALARAVDSFTVGDVEAILGGQMTDRIAELDRMSLGEFLEPHMSGPDARELVGATTALEVWWDKAVSMFLRDELIAGDGLEEIVGGMDRLPKALEAQLQQGAEQNVIKLGIVVRGIELTDAGVRLHLQSQAGSSIQDAELVLCTVPFSVLRQIRLVGLSPGKMRAIRNLNYTSSAKVLLHCRERFWEGPKYGIFGGASISDTIVRQTYYPSDNAQSETTTEQSPYGGLHTAFAMVAPRRGENADPHRPGVLVGCYNWGPDARRLGALSHTDRARVVVDTIQRFHPEIEDHVDDHASMFWDEYPWTSGAFCFMRPGDLTQYYRDAIRPEGGLHFAGEHCSLDQGWIQGALVSGLRAVEAIVSH